MTEQTKNEYTDEGKLADAGIGITAGSIFILIMLGKPLNKHFDTIGAKIWTGFFVSCMVLMIVYRDDLPPRKEKEKSVLFRITTLGFITRTHYKVEWLLLSLRNTKNGVTLNWDHT